MAEAWNSPELALAVACCRWPPSPAREQAMRTAAAAPIDWDRLARVAARHRVEALVADGLKRSGVAAPAHVAAALDRAAAATARAGLHLAAEALRLKTAFAAAGIAVLFIKGAPLAMLAYGGLALKSARDVDLLVAPADEAAAETVLRRFGYRLIEPDPSLGAAEQTLYREVEKETGWLNDAVGAAVDLHRRLVNYRRLVPGLSVRSPSQMVALPGGAALPTLAPAEQFAYLVVHGALTAWFRLKWIADVAALLAQEEPAAIEALYRDSQRLGAGRCAGQALLLCARLFDTPVPAPLLARLRRDRWLRRLERVALTSIGGVCADAEPADHPAVARRISLSYFLLGHGWRHRLEVAQERWICFEDRVRLPLPRRLHFLYPIIRVPLLIERRVRRAARA